MKARKFVTGVLAFTILIAAAWSVANISAVAYHYHESRAAWLIGLAFGAANAISVFVLAISDKNAKARLPAITGTLIFGLGSAAIQFHLYHSISGVSVSVAIWFASLGPAAEAILAWMEAAMTADEERRKTGEQTSAWERMKVSLKEELDEATRMREAAESQLATVEKDNEKKRLDITRLRGELERMREEAQITKIVASQAQSNGSQADDELLREIGNVVGNNEINTAADLIPYISELNSVRSAQRAMRQAKEAGIVSKNGAGYKKCLD